MHVTIPLFDSRQCHSHLSTFRCGCKQVCVMPRRKVHPANRVRAVQACSQCRSAKRRCNGQLPCSLCIRRGKETHCTFGGTTHASESPGQLDPAPSSRTSQDVAVESEEDSPGEARHRINPRLLSNSHGERGMYSPALCTTQSNKDSVHRVLGLVGISSVHSRTGRQVNASFRIHRKSSSYAYA